MSKSRKFSLVDLLDQASKWLITGIWAAIAGAGALLIHSQVPDGAVWALPAKLILYVFGASSAMIVLLSVFLLQGALRSRKKMRFGVMWDRDGNPVCGKCDGPIYPAVGGMFYCSACSTKYPPFDPYEELTPKEAMKRVREKR